MGKTSKTPAFSTGTIKVNGETKASTYKNGNNVISDYKMSDAEKQAYDYAQNSFAQSLPNINVFDKNTQQNLQSQLDAYTLNGQKLINQIYNPMLNNLKNDIASRFGNFDNSVFLDNLNSIETNRADAVNSLAQDVMSKHSELVNNELSQRYNYLNFLQNIQNQTNSNILNHLTSAQQNSNMGNSYYNQTENYNNLTSNLLGATDVASSIINMIKKYR